MVIQPDTYRFQSVERCVVLCDMISRALIIYSTELLTDKH